MSLTCAERSETRQVPEYLPVLYAVEIRLVICNFLTLQLFWFILYM